MHVSYSEPTVNDGKEWERGGCGCPATTRRRWIGRCHVALHGRKLCISAAGKILYFMTRV